MKQITMTLDEPTLHILDQLAILWGLKGGRSEAVRMLAATTGHQMIQEALDFNVPELSHAS